MALDSLQAYSDQLAATVAKVAHSTARVDARNGVPGAGIVWSADGVIVTADHVIEREENIRVELEGGTYDAELAGRDPNTDLAVLRVKGATPVAADIAGPQTLKAGHLVIAVARPWGDTVASAGIVSSIGQFDAGQRWGEQFREGLVNAELTLYPGFSGGPLADASGRVVGMNTSGPGQRMRIAIPSETIARVAAELLKEGRIKHGFLGIGVQKIPLAQALGEKLALKQETALMVLTVEAGSAAEKGGFFPGDILVGLGDETIARVRELHRWLGTARPGQQVQARVIRGGEIKELSVTIGER
ncbi:MAG: trypsin-like peptidase domain-containing protein [Anaerolineae bacterium]